MQVFLELKNY